MPDHTILVPWEDMKNYVSVIVLALAGAIGVLWATYIKYTAKSAEAFGRHLKEIHNECKQERETVVEHAERERELLRMQFGHEREHWKTERAHLVERIEILEALMKRFACDAGDFRDRKPIRFRRAEEP